MTTNQQLTCDCGSTYFYKSSAEQFLLGGYGSAEFRSTSNAPHTVLVCLCGKPVLPKPNYYNRGTVAGVAEDDFRKSTDAAQKKRDEVSMKHVAEIAASPTEVQELRSQVSILLDRVEVLTADLILMNSIEESETSKDSVRSSSKAKRVAIMRGEPYFNPEELKHANNTSKGSST